MTRLLLLRLEPGMDLHDGIEAAAREHGIRNALVRGGTGSLLRATLQAGGPPVEAPGPAAEILTMVGELQDGVADLHGTVGDPTGQVHAGRFLRGRNPVCITVELALESLD